MSYGEDPKIPCCYGSECNGNGMTIDGGRSAFPAIKEYKARVCDKCLPKVVSARNEYIDTCDKHYRKTNEHLALKDGCAYCGGYSFTIILKTKEAKYGEYCSMGCAMMCSDDISKININPGAP